MKTPICKNITGALRHFDDVAKINSSKYVPPHVIQLFNELDLTSRKAMSHPMLKVIEYFNFVDLVIELTKNFIDPPQIYRDMITMGQANMDSYYIDTLLVVLDNREITMPKPIQVLLFKIISDVTRIVLNCLNSVDTKIFEVQNIPLSPIRDTAREINSMGLTENSLNMSTKKSLTIEKVMKNDVVQISEDGILTVNVTDTDEEANDEDELVYHSDDDSLSDFDEQGYESDIPEAKDELDISKADDISESDESDIPEAKDELDISNADDISEFDELDISKAKYELNISKAEDESDISESVETSDILERNVESHKVENESQEFEKFKRVRFAPDNREDVLMSTLLNIPDTREDDRDTREDDRNRIFLQSM